MSGKIEEILINSEIFEPKTLLIRFDKADKDMFIGFIRSDPNVMVPFFVMVCGFSVRELERLYGIKDVYSLRVKVGDLNKLMKFAEAIEDKLRYPLHPETALYKFDFIRTGRNTKNGIIVDVKLRILW